MDKFSTIKLLTLYNATRGNEPSEPDNPPP